MHLASPRRVLSLSAAIALATVGGWSAIASAAGPPTRKQLHAIGSTRKAARTQPFVGLGAAPLTQPLIAVSFSGSKAVVLGGSAIPSLTAHRAANIPISATQCSVNFTDRKARVNAKTVSVRWFAGISCTRRVFLFGQAFLAQSASRFSGSGSFYTGVRSSAASGRSRTVIGAPNPSVYIWHATNIYFQERPSRGVIVVTPSPGLQINAATACKVAKSPRYGFGVHCDLYSQRF